MTVERPDDHPPKDREPAPLFLSTSQFLAHWQGHRALTRRTIERFPEEELFRYIEGPMRTFGEMTHELLRIALPMVQQVATGQWDAPKGLPETRTGILAAWDASTEAIDALWKEIPASRFHERMTAFGEYEGVIREHFLYALENEVHHRAQGFVYLRALGVEPPFFWERE